MHRIALHGALRALDYQDVGYANEYLDALIGVAGIDCAGRDFELSNEVARQLALQMCYEDTVRVAELKTRSTRSERVRKQLAAGEGQPVRVIEYLHPRIEEVCDTLPAWLGRRIIQSSGMRKLLSPLFNKGRNITTTNLGGYLLMHWLAKMKRFRRGSYRYGEQQKLIGDWLDRVRAVAASDYDAAVAIARSIEAVRGYSDTYERGLARYRTALKDIEVPT